MVANRMSAPTAIEPSKVSIVVSVVVVVTTIVFVVAARFGIEVV